MVEYAPAVLAKGDTGGTGVRMMAVSDRAASAWDGHKLTREQVVAALAACQLLSGLPAEEVECVADVSGVHLAKAGTDIFLEGDPSKGLWILARGRVRLYHSSADGRQRVVSFAMPSSPLELGAALDGRPFSATATALDDSVLLFLPRKELIDIGRRHMHTVRNAVDHLCLEIRQRDINSAIATLKDAKGRVGCALLQLARQYGVPTAKGVRIDYRLSRQDIADRAGVRLETVIRILSDLTRQEAVRTEDQVIEIVRLEALQGTSACDECQFDCSVFAAPYSSSVS